MKQNYNFKFYTLLCLLLLGSALKTKAQYNYVTVPAAANGTSGSGRGPVTSFNAHRSSAVYIASEFTGLLNAGDTIKQLGFYLNTAITSAVTGTIKFYMCNTTDVTNTRGTTWSSILTSPTVMDTVYSGPMTIPAVAATTGFVVTLTKPFKYTGSGIYVAYEWTVTSPAATAAVYWCNTAVTNGQCNAQGTTLPASLTSISSFRAQLRIGITSPTNDATVTEVYSLGKLPIPFGAPYTIKARVKNNGGDTLNNLKVYLKINGTNLKTDSTIISQLFPGIDQTVAFNAYIPILTGFDTVSVFVPNDNNNSNNLKTYGQVVNLNTYNYADPLKTVAGGVGFTGATGDFVAKFPYTGTNSINQIGVNFSAGGTLLKVGIWDTSATGVPGNLLWSSAPFTTAAGLNTIPVNPPIAITGTFFVGVIQSSSTNASFSYQSESPIRTQTFYYTSPTGSTTWSDFSSTASNFRFMIEPRLQLANDLSTVNVLTPAASIPLGQPAQAPSGTVYNYGSSPQVNAKVKCQIRNPLGTLVYNDSSTISFILSNQSVTVNFPTNFTAATNGNYTVKIWTSLSSDGDRSNDTSVLTLTVNPILSGGNAGNRLQFDGVDDYIQVNKASNLLPNFAFTFETWVRPSSLTSTGTIFSMDTALSDTSFTMILNGLSPQVVMKTSNATVTLSSTVPGILNSWTHVAATYDGTKLQLYVNGDTAGAVNITGQVNCAPGPLYIGRRAGIQNPLNAGLDQLKFWNNALTSANIRTSLHYKTPPFPGSTCLLYYRFDEGVNSFLLSDYSGNSNVGNMINCDYFNGTTTPSWFTSSLPLDTTLGSALTISNSTLQTFPNKKLAMTFYNLTGSQVVVAHYIRNLPLGILPDSVIATAPRTSHDNHWVIYNYGGATYDSCRAVFTLNPKNLGASCTATQLYLANRDNGASGVWNLARNPADAFSVTSQTVTFRLPLSGAFTKQYGIASSSLVNPLPVEMLSFTGARNQDDVRLLWATASEINNKGFSIERSTDGILFTRIGFVKGAGNTVSVQKYTYNDAGVVQLFAPILYYRLIQEDVDGNEAISKTIRINMNRTEDLQLHAVEPNPFNASLQVDLTALKDMSMPFILMDINGKVMIEKAVQLQSGFNQIVWNEVSSIPAGFYMLKIGDGQQAIIKKLIKTN